jgi:hypothetical protein
MVKDGAIDSAARLFEAIINYARENKRTVSAGGFSDKRAVDLLGDAAIEGIPAMLPEPLRNLWKRGLHYRTRNLARS